MLLSPEKLGLFASHPADEEKNLLEVKVLRVQREAHHLHVQKLKQLQQFTGVESYLEADRYWLSVELILECLPGFAHLRVWDQQLVNVHKAAKHQVVKRANEQLLRLKLLDILVLLEIVNQDHLEHAAALVELALN